jgi:D-serine deaminase-like pyridoxal phosphate-dependent protein
MSESRGLGPNEALIGHPGSRARLATPALVIDLDAFEHNIETMAAHFAARPESLRPHSKTHKSGEIAKRQMAAGAIGVCCAKLGEAFAMAEQGIDRIHITSPIVTADKIERLLDLNDRMAELMLVVDSVAAVDLLAAAAARRDKRMRVLVDLGVGRNRTGAATVASAAELAAIIATKPALRLSGLQCYAGHVQHIEECEAREEEAMKVMDRIGEARDAIKEATGSVGIVTGGGTGSYDIDPDAGLFTDLQVGSYIFMDVQYNDVMRRDGTAGPFRTSLFVQSTVLSANVAGQATTDAGFKAFAMDGPAPVIHSGAPAGSAYGFMGDEHGLVVLPKGANGPQVGDIVECVTPHCDPTVNLHDFYHCVRGDTLEDIWRIDGRGQTW